MNKLLITALTFCCFSAVKAQDWVKNMGGSNNEYVSSKPLIKSNGNLVVLSESNSTNGSITDPTNGGYDLIIHEFDQSGNLLFQKSFGGPGNESGKILQTSNGNFLIYGYTDSQGGDILTPINGSGDIWVALLSPSYDLIWSKTFGGDGEDYASGATIDNSQNSFCIEYNTNSSSIFGISNLGEKSSGVFKLDFNGTIINSKLYSNNSVQFNSDKNIGSDIINAPSGYFISGRIQYGDTSRVYLNYINESLDLISVNFIDDFISNNLYNFQEEMDVTFNSFNSSLNILLTKMSFELGDQDDPNWMTQYLVICDFDATNQQIVKTDSIYFPNANLEGLYENILTISENLLLFSGSKSQDAKAKIIDLNNSNLVTQIDLAGNSWDAFRAATFYNNSIYITGESESNESPFTNFGSQDVFLSKYIDLPLSIVKVEEIEKISIYPNPVTDKLIVNNVPMQSNYTILDVKGCVVFSGSFENSNEINFTNYEPGMYYLKIEKDGLIESLKIVK